MSIPGTAVSSPSFKRQAWSRSIVLLSLLPLAGCLASAPGKGGGGGGSGTQTTTVTISPASASVFTSGTLPPFQDTVVGPPDTAVVWFVNNIQNGDLQTVGKIDGAGVYTAPAHVPSPNTVSVTAQTVANNTVSNTATITISTAPTVTVTPNPIFLPVGGNQTFTPSVSGVSNPVVAWSMNSVGNCATNGSISNGVFVAPSMITVSPCAVTITASTTVGNVLYTGNALANVHATVTINGPPGNLSAGPPDTIGLDANWQYTATVNGASAANQEVSWFPYSSDPGNCTAGSFSPPIPNTTGLYFAPNCVPPSPQITITATATFDPSWPAKATVTVQSPDPLGTPATGSTIPCPTGIGGVAGGVCYQINTTCPGIATWPAYLKVNTPAGSSLGTVILGTGSGGSALYDNYSDFFYNNGANNGGLDVVQGILDGGFTTVQVSFGSPFNNTNTTSGWLTGPGGVRRLACRYAAVAQWVYDHIHNDNTNLPMCATGNSGGSGAIAYAVTDYGLDNILAMVETTSGPPMTRLDEACVPPANGITQNFTCNPGDTPVPLPLNYSLSEAEIIDPAYSQPFCSNAINQTGTQAAANLFLSDSVLGGPQPPSVTPTYVNILLGGQDTSAAVMQGSTWGQALMLTLANRPCVEDAPHPIPAAPSGDGAARIVSDIQMLCKLP